jgi:multiple sugar transport system substrate-binding protein
MSHPLLRQRRRNGIVAVASFAAVIALGLSGCTGAPNDADGDVTITLAGPNQWNSETRTFGPAWDDLVAAFESDNPGITVKTEVLPLSSWSATLSTQLTAQTAPELIFNQTTHTADQVLSLDPYLAKPNPFAETDTWLDGFDERYFGDAQKNADGHHEWIPFNLVAVGIYYNADLLTESGIEPSDLETFEGFTDACKKLADDGVNPLATDNSALPSGWALTAIQSMLLPDVVEAFNSFDAAGNPGTADPVTQKSYAQAILNGTFDVTASPEVAAAVTTLKEWYDACATPNWSGVSAQGAFTGGTVFPAGKAAMAWGTDFSGSGLADVDFDWGAVPFPTLSADDSEYATGGPAQFGVAAGGTSYMIPSYVDGDKRDAAIRFLQYASSPKAQKWIDETGAIPAVHGVTTPKSVEALTSEDWATQPVTLMGVFFTSAAKGGKNGLDGYLIGTKDLGAFLAEAQQNNVEWAEEAVEQNGWTDLG